MRVFMLGWEFPPFISGGLGTACYGLTKAMSGIGTDIIFVLPRPVASPFSTHVRLVSPHHGSPLESPSAEFRLDEFDRVTFRMVAAQMGDPYVRPEFLKKPNPPATSILGPEERDEVAETLAVGGEPLSMPAPVPVQAASPT